MQLLSKSSCIAAGQGDRPTASSPTEQLWTRFGQAVGLQAAGQGTRGSSAITTCWLTKLQLQSQNDCDFPGDQIVEPAYVACLAALLDVTRARG